MEVSERLCLGDSFVEHDESKHEDSEGKALEAQTDIERQIADELGDGAKNYANPLASNDGL